MKTARDVLLFNLDSCRGMLTDVLTDLTDADLLARSSPAANHTAWQLGHLISSEVDMMRQIGAQMPELPAGFADAHKKDAATSHDPKRFATKQKYLELLKQVREASLAAIAKIPDADFAKEAPERMRSYAPTIGAVVHILGAHELMHVGQVSAVRRKLGKPVLY